MSTAISVATTARNRYVPRGRNELHIIFERHFAGFCDRILHEFYAEATARPLLTGMVIAHQNFGDMLRWNPHFHAIVLEGGFDEEGTFFYTPFSGLQSMVEVFRRRVIKLHVERELLNESFTRNLMSWKHSGFSIDNSVRILDEPSQASLAEYIARPPISLKKIRYEPFKGRVLFHITYSEYFKQEEIDTDARLGPPSREGHRCHRGL